MEEVRLGKRLDATIQDNPAAVYFTARDAGPAARSTSGRQPGFYVIYLRKDDASCATRSTPPSATGLATAACERIYTQVRPVERGPGAAARTGPTSRGRRSRSSRGRRARTSDEGQDRLAATHPANWSQAAGMTVFLSVASFPLAMLIGLLVAVGRVYGPRLAARSRSAVYVEVLRGTPLLLQLYFLFYLLPQGRSPVLALGTRSTPGILGLAINYSAYEAENYRAGLLAIPRGQMEAALALGMSPAHGDPPGDRAAGGAHRHPAGDQRLHRAVQGHVGLLGDPHHRTDPEVQRAVQLQPRPASSNWRSSRPAVPADELPAVAARPLAGAAASARARRGRADDPRHQPGEVPRRRCASSTASASTIAQGRGAGRHRPVRRRQEHAPALHQRAGAVPGGRGRGRRR